MAYSTDTDVSGVLPNAFNYATALDTDSPATTYSQHRTWATAYIDNTLRERTATPVTVSGDSTLSGSLAEIEALLIAHRLIKANFTKWGTENIANEGFVWFQREADKMLKNTYFPASANTPTKMPDFTGNGTIAVVANDQFGFTADWVVQCTSAGTTDARFRIWTNRGQLREEWFDYDLSTDSHWPSEDDINSSSPQSLIKYLKITITAGATAFSLGDTWTFRSYARYRPNRKAGIGWIPVDRTY